MLKQLQGKLHELQDELSTTNNEKNALMDGITDLRDTLARERGDSEYRSVQWDDFKATLPP